MFDNWRHPLYRLFEDVNPYMSKYQLKESIVTCLDIWGEAMGIKDRETRDGVPIYLWPQNPEEFTPQFRGNVFVGWDWSHGGRKEFLLPEEVIQFKYFNPYDQIGGYHR